MKTFLVGNLRVVARPLWQAMTLAFVSFGLATLGAVVPAAAQDRPGREVVANLASGRAIFCVTKNGIVVAVVGGGGEAGSRLPPIVPLPAERIAVLLGAVEWSSPDSGAKPLRLDAELPGVATRAIRRPLEKSSGQMNDIEQIGVGLLEELRPVVTQIHHKLDLAADEPLVEMLLTDYVENYGFEIWSLQYRIRQEALGNDYWQTRILRPAYVQLYPPEKGQPKTLVEVRYPTHAGEPTLAARLAMHDERLERIRFSSEELTMASNALLAGDSTKAMAQPMADFLRASLSAEGGDLVLALLDGNRGFQWLLAPQEPPPTPADTRPVEPGAPSLRNRRPPPQ